MKHTVLAWKLIALIALSITSDRALALEWITLNPLKIEILITLDTWRRSFKGQDTDQYDLEGGFRLEQEGYVLDPGIVKFSYYLEPKYTTGKYVDPHFTEDRSDNSLGYYFTVDFLHGATLPVMGSIVASSSSQTNTGSLGRRSETDLTYYMATLTWKFRPFPITFRLEDRSLFQINSSSTGRPATLRDEDEQIFLAKGRSSKTQVEIEHRNLDDKVPERDHDFDLNRATLRHLHKWGYGSRLNSWLKYYDRKGFNAVKHINWSESASIQHKENLTSRTEYRYSSVTQDQESIDNNASFKLTHRLYNNLTTSGLLLGGDLRTDNLVEKERQVGLEVTYQKADIKGANVSLFVGRNFSNHDRESRAGFFEIVGESHRVPLTSEVILNNRFIATSTIIVTDASGTLLFTEGIDYEIIPVVDNLTQLFVMPGGQILVGDLILVSYKAAVLPSVNFDQLSTTGSLTLQFAGFSFSYFDNKVDYTVISGDGGEFLSDTRNTTTRLDYVWDRTRTSIQVSAERRFFKNGLFEVTTDTFSQSIAFRFSQNTLLNLNLTESFSDSVQEKIDLYLLDFTLDWQPKPNWSIRPSIGAWQRTSNRSDEMTGISDEDILTARLYVRWSFRKLSMDLAYNHNDRTTDGTNSVDNSLLFNLRRRFR